MIERWLYTHQTLHGEVGDAARLFREQPGALLAAALGLPAGQPDPDGAFTLPVWTPSGARTLAATMGAPRTVAGREHVPLTWQAEPGDAFSTLEGALEFEQAGNEMAEVALFGRCSIADSPQWLPTLDATEQTMRRIVRGVTAELGRAAGATTGPAHGTGPLLVRDLMTPDPIVLQADLDLPTAAQVLLHYRIGGAPVVDAEGTLLGVLSESDLLAREAAPRVRTGWGAREEARRRHATTVGDACSRPAVTVPPLTPLREAARTLHDRDVSRLVVVTDGRVRGILTRHDVLRVLTRTARQLQDAVDARLEARGVKGVKAVVDAAGRVLLTGEDADRRTFDDAEHAVLSVDGITEAHRLHAPGA